MVFSAKYNWQFFKKKYNLPWFFKVIGHYKTYLYEVLAAAFFLQLMGIAMLFYSRILSLVVLIILPLFVLLNVVVAPVYKRLINERFLIGSENQSFLIEAITGIHTVKSSSVEGNFIRRYEEILARYVKSVFAVINLANIAGSIGMFLQQIFNLAILWVGAIYVMTKEERHLWFDFLAEYPLRIQRQKTIANYIVDFYCAKAKLAIELDGSQHYEPTGHQYDEQRTKKLEQMGITVLRFTNLEIWQEFVAVKERIHREIQAHL